jgi:AmiR/NasT family two-component response regulator
MTANEVNVPMNGAPRDSALELEGLRIAMHSRAGIEQAKGALMALHGCDADGAFAMLVRESQRRGVKLQRVATDVLERLRKQS